MPLKRIRKNRAWVGLDLSLVGTGIVLLDQNGDILRKELIKTTPKDTTEVRLLFIMRSIRDIIKEKSIIQIDMEGLSFGSRGQAMLQLAALHYFVRIYFFKKNYNYNIIPPTTLKKHITGKGNAKKELMLMKIFKKYGIEFTDNNIADAYALARYGMENNVESN